MADVDYVAPLATNKAENFVHQATATATEKLRQTADAASQGLKDIQTEVTGGLKQAAGMARTYVDVQRTALETVVKASQIYGEGLQNLAARAAEVNRAQFEDTMAHLKALTGVKSVKDALSLQAEFARAAASRALSETSTFMDDYLKVTGQALAPVTARVREAAEKVKTAA